MRADDEPPMPLDEFDGLGNVVGISSARPRRGKVRRSADARPDDRPDLPPGVIPCGHEDFATAIVETVRQLAEKEVELFRHLALDLVTIHRDEDGPRIKALSRGALRYRIARSCRFAAPDRSGMMVSAPFPEAALDVIYTDPSLLHPFRRIHLILECPAVRNDGSLFPEGLDEATGIYIDTSRLRIDRASIGSTKAEAEAAYLRLVDLVDEFPFKDGLDATAAIAMILTAAHRPVMRVSPAYLVDSPSSEIGKSLLVDVASAVASGSRASAMNVPKEPDEFRKRVFAALLGGAWHLAFDNVAGYFGSPEFDSLVTSETYKDRELGKSEIRKVENRALITITGRNVIYKGDAGNRIVRINLKPAKRDKTTRFRIDDLPAYIAKNRAQILADCMTIARAYILAGRPNPLSKREFNDWNLRIREPLVWLGLSDIADAITPEADEDWVLYSEVCHAWHDYYGTDLKTLSHVLKELDTAPVPPDGKHERLKDAIESLILGAVGAPSAARIFSLKITTNFGRPTAEGLTFKKSSRAKAGLQWHVGEPD